VICFFRLNGLVDDECDGRIDRMHFIPQQRIKAAFPHLPPDELHDILWDPRIVAPGCRRHHYRFDYARKIRLNASQYPEGVHEWAQEHGFEFFGPERGWVYTQRKEEDHD